MKEKIKTLIKKNIYNIVVILTILVATFTFIIKQVEEYPIVLFILVAIFFLSIMWFFSQDKQIKDFREVFNKKFPFLGKTIAIVFRIFIFLIFLLSIFIIIAGIIDTFEQAKREKNRPPLHFDFSPKSPSQYSE